MFGNLVASLIAAEAIVTTEAKAKALRPIAEKMITKARAGGVHNHRQVVAFIRDKDMAHRLFEEIAPPLQGPPRRVPADPQARNAPRRQRADGARRVRQRLIRHCRVSTGDVPGKERAAHCGPLVRVVLGCSYDGTDFHGFADQPGQVTVGGTLLDCLARVVGERVGLTVAGRTDAGVHRAHPGRPRRSPPERRRSLLGRSTSRVGLRPRASRPRPIALTPAPGDDRGLPCRRRPRGI